MAFVLGVESERKLPSASPSYILPGYHSTFSTLLTGHQIKNIQDTADKVGEFANKIRAIQAQIFVMAVMDMGYPLGVVR